MHCIRILEVNVFREASCNVTLGPRISVEAFPGDAAEVAFSGDGLAGQNSSSASADPD